MANTSTNVISRRAALQLSLGLAAAPVFSRSPEVQAAVAHNRVTVWKAPDCGCCGEWVSHLRSNGFEVVIQDVKDTAPMRQRSGLSEKFGACHTALLGTYVLEGHVPAREVRRLLRERPRAIGLAVPGMPAGSPGMEMGSARDAYDVLLVLKDGSSRVYQTYPPKSSLNPKESS